MINFRCLIFFVFFLFGKLSFSINEDSLTKIINGSTTSQKDKLKALNKLITFYRRKDPAKTENYFKQYETLYKTLKDTVEFSGMYHNIKGFQLLYNGNQKQAIKHLEVAEIIYASEKNYEALWGVYNNFGSAYQNLNDLPNALKYYLKSMEVGEKHLDDGATAGTAMNIGIIYAEQKMFKEALKYFRLSASVYSKVENSWGYGNDLNNIGQVYEFMEQNDSAEYYFKAAIDVWNKMKDQQGLAMTYHNLGNLYGNMEKFPESESYLQKSLALSYEMGDSYGITVNLGTLSKLAFAMGYKDKGLKYLNESLEYAEKNQLVGLQTENYKQLYEIYKKDNNFKVALDFHEKFFALYDSTNNKENNKAIKEMQEKYESEKKQAEIDKQKLALADKDLELSEHNRKSTIYISIIIVAILIVSFVFYQFLQKQKSNKIILAQKKEVEIQMEIVDEKNKEILDSISYAKRLQEAILPPESLIKRHLSNSFILYLPKDIVAGDFYWMEPLSDCTLIAAADCTGHGVPGALVSVVCSNALHRTVNEFKITEPGKILDKTRELVLETFSKSESEVKDGMDISLLSVIKSNNSSVTTIKWAGANNGLWYTNNNEIKELKPHKQPIGKTDDPSAFPTHTFEINKGERIYLITDGYVDQFGGPRGKKYKYKQLIQLLLDTKHLPIDQQKQELASSLSKWKGDLEQVDDITIIGIEV